MGVASVICYFAILAHWAWGLLGGQSGRPRCTGGCTGGRDRRQSADPSSRQAPRAATMAPSWVSKVASREGRVQPSRAREIVGRRSLTKTQYMPSIPVALSNFLPRVPQVPTCPVLVLPCPVLPCSALSSSRLLTCLLTSDGHGRARTGMSMPYANGRYFTKWHLE